ncbi:hypothetical protein [Streptomyces sp. NPDC059881]|uniref:hypothetical protein n=1 Tax=Streptomyces sp. NPDC059881 TaxID=3346986 RepID=UPI00364AC749
MEIPGPLFRRRLLIESLIMLAADSGPQVSWLAGYGVMPDELALDFDHAFGMAEALVAEGYLTHGVMPDLRDIDATLSSMGGAEHADRWTTGALDTDEGWALVRELARRVLVAELGEWQQPLPEITVIR